LTYDESVIAALRVCWATLDGPAGKRVAPALPQLLAAFRRHGELLISDQTTALLIAMSAATIDRRLAPDRQRLQLKGRSLTKPGSLLKSKIPMRTWADWDDHRPGFVEIDLVGHEGGDNNGDFASPLTVTDIATGWTEERTVRNKAAKHVFCSLLEIQAALPFPLLGIDSDNGSEFINEHLLAWCQAQQITFTRSRPANSNDGCHVEQKNWDIARRTVGYWRYDTAGEVEVLNRIWPALSPLINLFTPQQKLATKGPGWSQGDQDLRHRPNPLPAAAGPPQRARRSRRPPARRFAGGHQPPPRPSARSPTYAAPCWNGSATKPSPAAARPQPSTDHEPRSTRHRPSRHPQTRQRSTPSGHPQTRHDPRQAGILT
jgi:hypothetical protein